MFGAAVESPGADSRELARLLQELNLRTWRHDEQLKQQGALVQTLAQAIGELKGSATLQEARPAAAEGPVERTPRSSRRRATELAGDLQRRLARLEAQVHALQQEDFARFPSTPREGSAEVPQPPATKVPQELWYAPAAGAACPPCPAGFALAKDQTASAQASSLGDQEDSAGNTATVVPPGVLTTHRLDAGDMFEMSDSVWDDAVFVGMSALGSGVSVVMMFVYLLNIFIQVAFTLIVWEFMLTPDVTTATLDGLLRFRVGLAHSVMYADTVIHRSMAAQICDMEDKLHMSGAQKSLYKESLAFSEGGPLLSLLAQMCWMGYIVREVNAAYCFTRAVLQLKRGKRTQVVTADSTGDDFEHLHLQSLHKDDDRDSILPAGNLVALTVVTRVTQLGLSRLLWCIFGIALPRAVVAIGLGIIGVFFLAKSARMEDLVLNAIALAFILDMDELLHAIFAPRRMHTLMNNIEPLPMPPLRKCVPGLNCAFKILLVAGGVLLVKLLLLDPFFWRLRQAQDILCSGEMDFVYATNPATGMVHVTKTLDEGVWTDFEKTIIQVAKPKIESRYGWQLDQELMRLSGSNFSMAVVTQTGMGAATGGVELSESDHEAWAFSLLKDMSTWSVAEITEHLPCGDLQAGNSFEQATAFLERVTGIPNFSCSMLAQESAVPMDPVFYNTSELCSHPDMINLRALCPVSCGCDQGLSGMTGFYGSAEHGCPLRCTRDMLMISDTWLYHTAITAPQMGWPEKAFCFDASDQLLVNNPAASVGCISDFSQCLALDAPFARWYAIFVRGIFPEMMSQWGGVERLYSTVGAMASVGLLPSQNPTPQEFIDHMLSGSMMASMLDGKWKFAENVPHPRGLTGCRFLASYELTAILGIDLCSNDGHTSIRQICPISCGCSHGMAECPAACTALTFEGEAPLEPEQLHPSSGGAARDENITTTPAELLSTSTEVLE